MVQSVVPEITRDIQARGTSDQGIDVLPPGSRLCVGEGGIILTQNDWDICEIVPEQLKVKQ